MRREVIREQSASLKQSHSVNGIFPVLSVQKRYLAIDLCHSPLMSADQKPISNLPSLIVCPDRRMEEEALVEIRQKENNNLKKNQGAKTTKELWWESKRKRRE